MRIFGEMWIPFLIGLLIVTSPFILFKIHSDYKMKAELSKPGFVLSYIFYSLFGMAIVNAALHSKLVFSPGDIPYGIIGNIFMVAGGVIIAEAFFEFRSIKRINGLKADKVISTGIYRFSRNPQLIGYHLFLIGFSLPYRSILAIILILIHLIIMNFIFVSGEEKFLEKSLGDEYARYKKRTRRWL